MDREWIEEGYAKRWVWLARINGQWVFCKSVYRIFSISCIPPLGLSSDSENLTEKDFILRKLKNPMRPINVVMHDLGYGGK